MLDPQNVATAERLRDLADAIENNRAPRYIVVTEADRPGGRSGVDFQSMGYNSSAEVVGTLFTLAAKLTTPTPN